MFIFLLLTFLAIVSAFLDGKKRRVNNLETNQVGFVSKLLFLLMFLTCALRAESVGVDTENYIQSYNSLQSDGRMELFHYLLINLISQLGGSEHTFIFVYTILIFAPLYVFVKRESINFGLAMLAYLSFSVYFYFETFNIMRACTALAWFLLSLSYLKKKNYLLATVFSSIAICFHYSVLIAVAVAVVYFFIKRIPSWFTIIFVALSLIFGILSIDLIGSSFNTLDILLLTLDSEAAYNYSNYISNVTDSSLNFYGRMIALVPFSLFAILLANKRSEEDYLFNLFVFGVIISNITASFEYSYRITIYFTTLLIIVLPNYLNRINGTKRTFILLLITFLVLFFIQRVINGSNMAGVLPYHTFFS